MGAPAGSNRREESRASGNSRTYREHMFAAAVAAKITDAPRSCPKCHAPAHCFAHYPHSLECNMCGWTGYFPTAIEDDTTPLELPRTLEQKRREAGYTRVNGMSRARLQRHMALARAAKKK